MARATPEAIVFAVVHASGVPVGEIRGDSRMPAVLAARWALVYLLRRYTLLSAPCVAKHTRPLNRSHTQILKMPNVVMAGRAKPGKPAESRSEQAAQDSRRVAAKAIRTLKELLRER